MSLRFSSGSKDRWVAVELEPFTALYHRPSGTTHLLVEPAPELLDALAEAALTLPELRARLAERYDLPDASDAALSARLAELVAAGLVTAA